MANKIVSLAKELIEIPSVTGEIKEAISVLEIVKKQLPEYKFTPFVSNHIPSLLYSNQGKGIKNFKFILNAHLDVVPGTEDQYKPFEKDGKLYGRGAYDMKAAGAVMILVFKELGHKLSYPLGLQLATDEELSGKNGTGYQVEQGIRTNFAIFGECNSDFRVTNQSKGRIVIKIAMSGRAAHSAYAWRGKNATWQMYEALEPVVKEFPIPDEETPNTTVNITKIEAANEATNKIPDNCTAYLDIRYNEKDKNTIVSKIRSLLPKNVSFHAEYKHPAHYVNPENSYIAQLRKAVKEIRGEERPLRLAHGTSDATFLSSVGCEAVEFGPKGGGAHHDQEWVDIQSLSDYYQILKSFLLSVETFPMKTQITSKKVVLPTTAPASPRIQIMKDGE